MARARHMKSTGDLTSKTGKPSPASSPALSVASALVGAIGLACGGFVSWLACIAFGIVAVVLGMLAHRKQAPLMWLAKIGIALGVVCIVASIALVAIVSFQMIHLGLLS